MFTIAFVRSAVERAVRGAASAALLVIGADQADVLALSWERVAGFAGGGALLSLLGSLAAAPIGVKGSPAITPDPGVPEPGVVER